MPSYICAVLLYWYPLPIISKNDQPGFKSKENNKRKKLSWRRSTAKRFCRFRCTNTSRERMVGRTLNYVSWSQFVQFQPVLSAGKVSACLCSDKMKHCCEMFGTWRKRYRSAEVIIKKSCLVIRTRRPVEVCVCVCVRVCVCVCQVKRLPISAGEEHSLTSQGHVQILRETKNVL